MNIQSFKSCALLFLVFPRSLLLPAAPRTKDELDESRPKWDKGGCEPKPLRVRAKSHDKLGAVSGIGSSGRQVSVLGGIWISTVSERESDWID